MTRTMKKAHNAKMALVHAAADKARAATMKLKRVEASAKKAIAKVIRQLKTKITKKQIKKVKGGKRNTRKFGGFW